MSWSDGDAEAWNELSPAGLSSSDEEHEPAVGHIESVQVVGREYVYSSQSHANLELHISHEKEKGLSFQIWPSSLMLSKYAEHAALQRPEHWKGKRVLELGCGCGLVGLVFAALGAQVLLTDLPQVLGLIRANIARNESIIASAGGSATACELTWGQTDPSSFPDGWNKPDLVVAADVIYHRELFAPLLSTLRAFGLEGTEVVLAHVRRWKSDKHFFGKARQCFTVADITSSVEPAGPNAALGTSHTRGALRIFHLVPTVVNKTQRSSSVPGQRQGKSDR